MSLVLKERAEDYDLDEITRMHKNFMSETTDPYTKNSLGRYLGRTCNFFEPTGAWANYDFSRVVNSYAKMLMEYFLSEDKEPRVFVGKAGVGKTLSYLEALLDLIPNEPELMPTVVVYKSFNDRGILDHKKLATEQDWGSERLKAIDGYKNSISKMLDASNIHIFDDMGYIFQDAYEDRYPIQELNSNLEEIIRSVDSGKKVLIVTNESFEVYAEKMELKALSKGANLDEIKKLNRILPKFGTNNPLHPEYRRDVNPMVYIEVLPEAFVSRMLRFFKKNGVHISDVAWGEKGVVKDSQDGLAFLYKEIGNPRKFLKISNELLEFAISKKESIKERVGEREEKWATIGTSNIYDFLKSRGIEIGRVYNGPWKKYNSPNLKLLSFEIEVKLRD